MARLPLLLSLLLPLTAAAAATPRPVHVPLDPKTLGGAAVFTRAESLAARAAETAGLPFAPDPRPLPPHVILLFDAEDGRIARHGGLVLWRGEMLPDQLAPGETGTMFRRKRRPDGTWKTTRRRPEVSPGWQTNLVTTARAVGDIPLPEMIIETAYHLGTAGEAAASLVLWRTREEDSAPIGGAIVLNGAAPGLADALRSQAPDFNGRAAWLSVFDALSP